MTLISLAKFGVEVLFAKTQYSFLLRARLRRPQWFSRSSRSAGTELTRRRGIVKPPSTEIRQGQIDLAPLRVPLFLQRREILASTLR